MSFVGAARGLEWHTVSSFNGKPGTRLRVSSARSGMERSSAPPADAFGLPLNDPMPTAWGIATSDRRRCVGRGPLAKRQERLSGQEHDADRAVHPTGRFQQSLPNNAARTASCCGGRWSGTYPDWQEAPISTAKSGLERETGFEPATACLEGTLPKSGLSRGFAASGWGRQANAVPNTSREE